MLAFSNTETLKREFLFTEQDFDKICKLIYLHAGIHLSSAKKDLVYSRLGRRLRANKLKTFADYINLLDNKEHAEWQAFINALTTNLTSFYREHHHFVDLAKHINSIKQRFSSSNPAKIWCNAASTGEEPYTIAITMMDLFNSLQPPVKIIATDIDTNALEKATAGVYTLEQTKKVPEDILKRFFLKGRGQQLGQVKVRPELQELVEFSQLNLYDKHWPVSGFFDAIFCRNVMIYFDKPTQNNILQKFAPLMQPDALLFAGHSESLHGVSDIFKLQGKTVYRLSDEYLANKSLATK